MAERISPALANAIKDVTLKQAALGSGQKRSSADLIIGIPKPAPPEPVKVFGSMLAAIQRVGHERMGQLWMMLRLHDEPGEGRLPLKVVKSWGYTSWANMKSIIRKGIKTGYFRREGEYLAYTSETKLALILGFSQGITGRAVAIPADELMATNIVDLRALFQDAYHSCRGDGFNNPISRGGWQNDVGIKAATGRCRQTQRRYEKRRGIAVRTNYADFGPYSPERLADLRDAGLPGLCVIDIERGTPKHIMARLSNAYRSTLATVKRSRRWLNHRILRSAGRVSTPCVIEHQQDETTIRRYYGSPQQAAKHNDEAINHVPCVFGWLGETQTSLGVWTVANVTGY